MSRIIRGVEYQTQADAARRLQVGVKKLRDLIREGTLPQPQEIPWGEGMLPVFTEEWYLVADTTIDCIRKMSQSKKSVP